MSLRDRVIELRRVPVAELIPNPKNWRTHSKGQTQALQGLITEVGFAGAALARQGVNGELVLIDGHLRRDALPDERIPVLVTDLTEEEADKVLATFDPIGAMAGRDAEALEALLENVTTENDGLRRLLEDLGKVGGKAGASDPDDEVQPLETDIKPGDLFILGDHRLLCGDSTSEADVGRLFGGRVPNLMVTDPPYGVDYDPAWREAVGHGARRTGTVANDKIVDWSPAWALFPGDVAYVWHAGIYAAEVSASLQTAGFEMRAQIIWAKQHIVIGRGAYHWQHEPCWYAVRTGRTASWEGGRKQTTLWEVANANGWGKSEDAADSDQTNHGTQKPVELFRRPISNHTEAGALVYDPFVGSGSAIIACEDLGRSCLAMEISPQYVAATVARWERFTDRKAERGGS
jgi:DNA modification methylase